VGAGGEMNQALYTHMNNKRKMKKKKKRKENLPKISAGENLKKANEKVLQSRFVSLFLHKLSRIKK
jgi:hypothetical protein